MWPERGEALSRTIEAEEVLAALYREAIDTWIVDARGLALRSLTAAADLPPDPAALAEQTGVLDRLLDELILTGLSTLYALALVEAVEGMEIEVDWPDIDWDVVPSVPEKVLDVFTSHTELTTEDVTSAVGMVYTDPFLRQQAEDFVETQRELVYATAERIQGKADQAMRGVSIAEARHAAEEAEQPIIEVFIERQRGAVAAVLTPGSEELAEVAELQSWQAAGVQNAAVIQAAALSEDVLDKTWIATLDGKTRDSHFAADGQRTPLAGTFTVGTAALRFPGDPAGPASEVRNCRCRVGVLAPDEAIPDEVDRHTERLNGRDSVAVNRKGSQRDEINRRADRGVVRAREDEDGVGRTAAGGWVAPSSQEYDMPKSPAQLAAEAKQRQEAAAAAAVATLENDGDGDGEDTSSETFRVFKDQPIAFVGIETSDGRMLAKDIELSFRNFPLPVMWCEKSVGGHYESYTVGVVEGAALDGDTLRGSGYWLNDEHADDAFGAASHKVSRPSVDLAATEWILTVDGKEISEEDWWDLPEDAHVVQTITKAELIGFTMVATPAFGDTMIEFSPERETRDVAVVASAAAEFRPRVYKAEHFSDPQLAGPTEIHMREDGRIVGHLACFGTCHRSIQANCVIAPRSPSSYAQFLTSPSVALDNGTRQRVGRLTVGTGHAPDTLSGPVAMAHYDNTGTCFALVNVGEDAHGIWVSGVAAPWATAEQIEMGLAAPLSGDWRDFGQGLDLIAALAVNTPGFAVRGRDGADGRPAALVASLGPAPTGKGGKSGAALSADDIASIVSKAVTEALAARDTDAEIDGLLAQAAEKVGPPEPPAPELTPDEEIDALLAEASI